jgi:hypothetical protein
MSTAFGVNQTWQDMTASRSFNTTYTNTTGRPIIFRSTSATVGASTYTGSTIVNGTTIGSFSGYTTSNGISTMGGTSFSLPIPSIIVVPTGGTYSCNFSGTNTSSNWMEFR